jgi:hypothetical protein
VGDLLHEYQVSFNVDLADATPNATIVDGWGRGTIIDNDPPRPRKSCVEG